MSESFLDLESWPEGIAAARIPANNNVRAMEAFIGPAISATTAAQPGSPAERDIYILPASPTGAMWGGFDEGDVVIYYEATWTAFAPFDGLRKFVADEGEDWQFVEDSSGGWAPAGGGGGSSTWGSITGTLSDQTDLQAALDAKSNTTVSIVTEASTSTMDPATHAGLSGYIRCADDVTFNNAEGYAAGEVYNIRATAALTLIGTGVTLTPPAGGTLDLDAAMSVTVVMTSSSAGDVIGQTVPA